MSDVVEVQLDKPAFTVVHAARLQELEQKAREAQDQLLRTVAEWENARKRMASERQDAIKYANEGLLESLLPIVDNFELGMQATANATDAKSIAVGMQMVLGQLKNFLQENGLEPVDAVGQAFDPHRHEAVGEVESTEVPEGKVASQVRRGYLYKGKLLRAATVYVAKKAGSS